MLEGEGAVSRIWERELPETPGCNVNHKIEVMIQYLCDACTDFIRPTLVHLPKAYPRH